jgi:single-stranded-DNA-specific exonuclease
MERYHRPVALLAGDGEGLLRASARAPQGFAVDQALTACADLLERFGGHPAAGGFTVKASQVHALHDRLNQLTQPWLDQEGAGRPVRPEACLKLNEINWDLWAALETLTPHGVGHPAPLFWSRGCKVTDWRALNGGHLAVTLEQETHQRRAVAWRCSPLNPMPDRVDVAYELKLNVWRGERRLQLELKSIREHTDTVRLSCGERSYLASRKLGDDNAVTFGLTNAGGDHLDASITKDQTVSCKDQRASHSRIQTLLEEAALALGLRT